MTIRSALSKGICGGLCVLLAGSWAGRVAAAAEILQPTPYLAFDNAVAGAGSAISPFKGLAFSYFVLETFEDHLFNAAGVTTSAGGVTSVVFGPAIHDSVDADDGVIDGSGLHGDDFFAPSGASGITFSFNAAVLGQLPTHVGLVWTDGGGGATITFRAFGPGGLLGSLIGFSAPGSPDFSNNGETAEDRFFGVIDAAGISSVFISNSGGGIEIDHL